MQFECRLLAVVLLLAPTLAAGRPRDEGNAADGVPLTWFAGKPTVEAKVNGQGPFRFFFDTGAAGTVLDRKFAEELRLTVVGDSLVGSPGGKGVPAKEVKLALDLAGVHVDELTAFAFDRSRLYQEPNPPRGVLSPRAFPGYLVTLDLPHDRLMLRKGALPEPDGVTVFAGGREAQRLFLVPVTVAGEKVDVFLDTGATGALVLPLKVAEKLPLADKPVIVGRGRRVDREVTIYGAELKGQVRVGPVTLDNPKLRFDDSLPRGVLGNEVLRKLVLTVDVTNHRFRLEANPKAQAP